MPRIRTIKPEFFTSEQLAECSTTARLLFVGMWCFCDDGGVHPASAARLKMEVFPADPFTIEQVAEMVDELLAAGLLSAYVVDDKEFWHVTGWHHQKIDKPTYHHPRSREFGEHSARVRRGVAEPSPPESSRVESKGRERERKKDNPAPSPSKELKRRQQTASEAKIPKSIDTPEFNRHWSDFLGHLYDKTGQDPGYFQAEAILKKCLTAGVDKAICDLKFSVEKGAKSLLDSSNDFSRSKNGNGSQSEEPQYPIRT